jgi:autotransporter translocation and assembly factor TamB
MRSFTRAAIMGGAVVVALAALLALMLAFPAGRTSLVSLGLRFVIWQRGYHFAGGGVAQEGNALVIRGLRITDGRGELFLIVKRATVDIDPAGIIGGSDRQFGLRSIRLDEPRIVLIRHEDGGWNYDPLIPKKGRAPTRRGPPWRMRLDVANGTIEVIDPQALVPVGKTFSIDGIAAALSIDEGARSAGTLTATLRTLRGSADIRSKLYEDDRVSLGRATIDVLGVPLAPVVDALGPSSAFIAEGGLADVHMQAWTLGWAPGAPHAWHLSGDAAVRIARLRLEPLALPVRDIACRLHYQDGLLSTQALTGDASGVPLRASGAITLIGPMRIAFAATQRGMLERERSLFAFSRHAPVRGPFAVSIRVDGTPKDIHIDGTFAMHDVGYARATFPWLRGSLYFANGHLTISAFDLAYAGARLWAGGDFDLDSQATDTMLSLQATAPAVDVPLVANVNPGGTVGAFATLQGPVAALHGSGYAQLSGGAGAGIRTFFSADAQRLSLGPLLYAADGGQIWLGASRTLRPGNQPALAAELIASHAGLHVRGGGVTLADISGISASLPSLDTTLDGEAFIGGDQVQPDIALNVRATQLVYRNVRLGDATLVASGRDGRVRIARATLDGPNARASVSGDLEITPRASISAAALQGTATADLSAFAPAFPRMAPRGTTSGSFTVAMFGSGWVAAAKARSANASIAGIPLRSGSALLDGTGRSTGVLANVDASGSDVWAVGDLSGATARQAAGGNVLAFAPQVDLAALRGLGLPLRSGSAVGFVTLSGGLAAPDVNAAAAVRSTYDNAPISGDLDIAYSGGRLRSNASRVAYAGNRATISGDVTGMTRGGASNIALDVSVRHGDLQALDRLSGQRAPLTGSFDADARIGGSSSSPRVDGNINTDIGTIRGVAFNGLRAQMRAQPGSVSVEGATVGLGSSRFVLDGDASTRAFSVRAVSSHVDMTDFNDFFGGADVFAGTGSFNVEAASTAGDISWGGDFMLDDAALRDYPLGHIDADFFSRRGALRAVVRQDGPVGTARISGTARFRPTTSGLPDLSRASYRLKAKLANVALDRALPLIHQEDLGLTGTLDADGQMSGTLRNPIGSATVVLHDGHLRRVRIKSFSATLASDAQGLTLKQGSLTLPYLSAVGEGRYEFAGRRIDGRASLRADDLEKVANAMRVPGTLGGSANADISVGGTLEKPTASLALDAGHATIYGIAFDQANMRAKYSPGEISLGDTSLTFAGNRGHLTFAGTLPVQLQPLALGPKDRPVDLTMRAEKIDLTVLDPIVGRWVTLSGNLNAAAAISGDAGNPLGKGTAQIRYASVHSPIETTPLTNLNADLKFDRDTITLQDLSGKVGTGSVDAQGAAHIVPAAGLRANAGLQVWSRIALHSAQVDVPGWLRGTLDGNLSLTRSGVTPYVEGTVAVSSATVPFSAIYDLATGSAAAVAPGPTEEPPGVPPLRPGHTIVYGGSAWGPKSTTQTLTTIGQPTPAPTGIVLPPVDVKLAVTAGKDVRVRGGSAIDLTTTGGVVIAGNLRAPTLDGEFSAVRGQVGYFDTTFRLVSGTVSFDPSAGLLPTMDVTAVTNVSGTQITLNITGRVDNLNTVLSSDPSMSREQIIATLLHAPQLTALTNATPEKQQAALVQTAQSYFNAQLSRSLLYPFESALAQQLNIESVSFVFDAQGNLAVEVRTRFTPSISAVYQTTLAVPVTQSYGVSYRLRDYLSLDLIEAQPNVGFGTVPNSGLSNTTLNLRYAFH